MLPHTNIGALGKEDLARLREVTASQGLMLESTSERLMETVHAGSPTKHPAARLATIEAAGELRIPFTSGILVGIGETEDERVESLEALAASHERHGHLQEVILQNFVPHPRYYGAEVAEIADEASLQRWGGDWGDPSVAKDGEAPPGYLPPLVRRSPPSPVASTAATTKLLRRALGVVRPLRAERRGAWQGSDPQLRHQPCLYRSEQPRAQESHRPSRQPQPSRHESPRSPPRQRRPTRSAHRPPRTRAATDPHRQPHPQRP